MRHFRYLLLAGSIFLCDFGTSANARTLSSGERPRDLARTSSPDLDETLLGLTGAGAPRLGNTGEVRIAKRGVKIGSIIKFFRGRGSGSLRGSSATGGKNTPFAQRLAALGIRGILVYGLIFMTPVLLFIAAFRFLRSILRGLFVSVRDADIIDARLTQEGKYRPIVAFEHSNGQVFRAVAPFETRKDPRGDSAAVEITGTRIKVVPFRRGFGGIVVYIFGPAILSLLTLIAAYYLDTS